MVPMTNRVKVQSYFYGSSNESNNFSFDIIAKFRLESTILESRPAGRSVGRTEKLIMEPAQPSWGLEWG